VNFVLAFPLNGETHDEGVLYYPNRICFEWGPDCGDDGVGFNINVGDAGTAQFLYYWTGPTVRLLVLASGGVSTQLTWVGSVSVQDAVPLVLPWV